MHPASAHILQYFTHKHLPEHLQKISAPFTELANQVAQNCDGPEATVALRKLLEAKDAAVRSALVFHKDTDGVTK